MKITRVQTGWVQIKRYHQRARYDARLARAWDVLTSREWTKKLPIYCWLIEHPEGLAMIDTGESAHANDPGYQPWWHPFMQTCERRWVAPEEEVGAQLRSLGHDPGDVRWVVMTHMHGDHAGGLSNFPKSEVLLSAEQKRLALSGTGPAQGYLNMHYPRWLSPRVIAFDAGGWETFETNAKLTRDGAIRIVPTPGHTPRHVSAVVEDNDRLIFIAGDAAYSECALLAGTVDGVAYSAAAHKDTTARIRGLCARRTVITQFAHDEDNARRFEGNIATVVELPSVVSGD